MQTITSSAVPGPGPATGVPRESALRQAAEKLEAAFLSEMLKASGVGRTPDSFGGGAGETQFASYLRQAQAEAMAESGGIGLAEHLFRALTERQENG